MMKVAGWTLLGVRACAVLLCKKKSSAFVAKNWCFCQRQSKVSFTILLAFS